MRLLPFAPALGLLCLGLLGTPAFGQATNGAAPAPAPGSATAAASIYDEDPTVGASHPIPDKIEGFNRGVFKFNDGFYHYFLRPLSKGYTAVMPRPFRRGIGNFFHNLDFPTRFVGNVLEARFKDAGTETLRFVINTIPFLGFSDQADLFPDLHEKPSDLGLAFSTWGIGHGTYLVLPLLGPSSLRDGIGLGISGYFLDPVHYVRHWEYRYGASALEIVNESPDQLRAYDQVKAAAIDPYISLRDAYASERVRRVTNDLGAPVAPPPPPASK